MAKKRGSGEGSIYKYPNGWRGQVYLGNKRVSFTGRTKTEVVKKIAEARADFNRGQFVFDSDVTLEEWLNAFLENYAKPKTKPQSYARTEYICNYHLIPKLGAYKLTDLNRGILDNFYATNFDEAYSISTVKAVAKTLNLALKIAVQYELILKNPHYGITISGNYKDTKKVRAYTTKEQAKIVERCKNGNMYEWIYYFLIATGTRMGEAVALTWNDVDFKSNTIKITKTTTMVHGRIELQNKTKTAAGNREISLANNVVDFLKRIQTEIDQTQNVRNLVFPNKAYNYHGQPDIHKRWVKICKEIDVPARAVHSLRHTWATRALERGIDVKTVSKMLGHSKISITMDIYQDVLKDHEEEAINKLNDLF